MRTIETTLYHFSELSEESKQNAVKSLRQQCYECNADWTWEDARSTTDFVEEVSDVWCDIQSSSQGFYYRSCHNKSEDYDLSDKEEFEQFRERYIAEFKESLWCDHMMLKLVKEWEYDERRSYAGNVAWMMVKFCEQIYDMTLDYYDDDAVEEWIEGQDFEFTEDGRPATGVVL